MDNNFYIINAKKISNVINIFESDFSDENTFITKKDLKDGQGNFIDKINFLLANPDEIGFVVFNFEKSKNESFVIENIENLYAAILSKKEIVFKVIGDLSNFENVFGKAKLSNGSEDKNKLINWDIDHEKIVGDTWGNVDFIIKKIKSVENPNEIQSILLNMNQELWYEEKFINEFVLCYNPLKINNKILFSEKMLSMIPTNNYYLDKYIIPLVNYLKNPENKNNENYDNVKKLFIEKFLSNEESLLEIINIMNRRERDFYFFTNLINLIPSKNIFSKKFLEKVSHKEYNNLFNVDSTDDEELVLKNHFFNLKNDFVKEVFFSCDVESKMKKWIPSVEAFKNILEEYDLSSALISKILDKNIRFTQDDELGKIVVNKYPQFFPKFYSLIDDYDLVRKFLDVTRDKQTIKKMFDDEFLLKCMKNDEELFLRIIESNPSFILHPECDKKFLELKDLVRNLSIYDFNKELFLKSCKTEDDAQFFVNKDYHFMEKIPNKLKTESVCFNYLLSQEKDNNKFLFASQIPKEILFKKSFCLKLLQKPKFCELVNKNLFTNMDFMLQVTKDIDEKKIPIENLPTKIRKFFEVLGTKDGYQNCLEVFTKKQELEDFFAEPKNKKKVSI